MSGINKVILVGHVKAPPKVQFLRGNVPYVHFQVGTKEQIPKGKEIIEHTEWHRVVMWRQQAELAAGLLKPDMLVHIEGQARTRSFMDGTIKRYITEIVAHYLHVL